MQMNYFNVSQKHVKNNIDHDLFKQTNAYLDWEYRFYPKDYHKNVTETLCRSVTFQNNLMFQKLLYFQ